MTEHLLDQETIKAYIGSILVAIRKEAKLTNKDLQHVMGHTYTPNALGHNIPPQRKIYNSEYVHSELTRLAPNVMHCFGQDLRDYGSSELGKNGLSKNLLSAILTPTGPTRNGKAMSELRVAAVFADCNEETPKRIPLAPQTNSFKLATPPQIGEFKPSDLWTVLAAELVQHIPAYEKKWDHMPTRERELLVQSKAHDLKKKSQAEIVDLWNGLAAHLVYKCDGRKEDEANDQEAKPLTAALTERLSSCLTRRGFSPDAPTPPENALLRRAYFMLRYRPK